MPDREKSWEWLRLATISIVAVSGVALAYLYFFTSARREEIVTRGMRRLGVIAADVESRIAGIATSLENLADDEPRDSSVQEGREANPDRLQQLEERIERIHGLVAERVNPRVAKHVPEESAPGSNITPSEAQARERVLRLESAGGSTRMKFVGGWSSALRPFEPSIELAELIGPRETGVEFEIVLLAHADGRVLFEDRTERTPTILARLDGLQTKADQPLASATFAKAGSVLPVRLAGEDFILIVQPVRIPFPVLAEDGGSSTSETWFACGLLREGMLLRRSMALPPTVAILISALLLLGIVSAPHLKLWRLGAEERYTSVDFTWLLASTVATIGFLTLIALSFHQNRFLGEAMSRDVEVVAERVLENLAEEVGAAHAQLVEHFKKPILPKTTQESGAAPAKGIPRVRDLAAPGGGTWKYPHFDLIAWIGRDGLQKFKWSTESQVTPSIDVSDRAYFVRASCGRMGRPRFHGEARADREPFAFDFIRSRNTGVTQAVVAKRIDLDEASQKALRPPELAEPVRTRADGQRADGERSDVGAIYFRPLSLVDPVLPAGMDFAILDDRGKVVHRAAQPGLRQENFLVECEEDSHLRAAFLARRTETLRVRYQGAPHHLRITPLGDQPWTLVVFRPQELASTVHLEIATSSFVCFAFPLFLVSLLGLSVRALAPRHRFRWIWPNRDSGNRYRCAALLCFALGAWVLCSALFGARAPSLSFVVLASLAALFLSALILCAPTPPTLRARGLVLVAGLLLCGGLLALDSANGFLLPLIALAPCAAIWIFFHRREKARGGLDAERHFFVLGASYLVVLAIAPATACFRDAFEHGMERWACYGQLAHAEALRKLERRFRPLDSARENEWAIYRSASLGEAQKELDESAEHVAERPPHFTSILTAHLPAINPSGVRLHRIGEADDPRWDWSVPGMLAFDEHPGSLGRRRIVSAIPSWSSTRATIGSFALLVGPLLLIAVLAGYLVKLGSRRLLHSGDLQDHCPDLPWPGASRSSGHRLLLGSPPRLGVELAKQGWTLLDLSEPASSARVADLASQPAVANRRTTLVLDRFEHRLSEPEIATQRLRLLEQLLSRSDTDVVVLSEVDPLRIFATALAAMEAGSDVRSKAEQELRRWVLALGHFVQHWSSSDPGARSRARPTADSAPSDARPEEVANVLGELEEAHSRSIWTECTPREQAVFWNVAREGFVNPNCWRDAQRLLRKGLLRWTPALEIGTRAFERFLVELSPTEIAREAAAPAPRSGWESVRPILYLLLIGLIFVLLSTGQSQVEWIVGTITATSTAVAALVRFFAFARFDAAKSSS